MARSGLRVHGALVLNDFEKSVVGAESAGGDFHVWLGLVFNKDGFFHKTGFIAPRTGLSLRQAKSRVVQLFNFLVKKQQQP